MSDLKRCTTCAGRLMEATMPDDLIRGSLSADKRTLDLRHATIPAGLVIPDSVTTLGLSLATIPDGLVIPDSVTMLDLTAATIPAGLVIPDSVTRLYMRYTTIPDGRIHTDPRGYRLYRLRRGATGEIWFAGCRLFFCRADALAHWGGEKYPDKVIGSGFVAAINATPPFGDDDA